MALDLTLQSTKDFILERTQEAVKYDDKQSAQEILKIFRDELPSQQEQVAEQAGLYDIYKEAWVSAQFICLPSIAEDDFFDLIKDHLVDGLRLEEYDIIDKIGLRISFMDLEAEQVSFMEQLLDIVRKNTGTLGTQNIKVGGRTSLPTVANWLADYDTYPSQAAQRSDYEEITYLSKSPNTASLSDEDKKILLDILDCYDSLRNLLAYYRAMPEAKEDFFKPENLYQFYPGATLVDSIEDEEVTRGAPPVASADTSEPGGVILEPESLPKPVITPTPTPVQQPAISAPQPTFEPVTRIVEDSPKPEPRLETKPQLKPEPVKPIQSNDVAEQIKNNLKEFNIQATRPPLNVQDFLNERHNRGNNRVGVVYDKSAKLADMPAPAPAPAPAPTPAPKPVAPPANLPTAPSPEATAPTPQAIAPVKSEQPPAAPAPVQPVASAKNAEDEIAKKLEELRKRKQP